MSTLNKLDRKDLPKDRILAEDHWNWLEGVCRIMYIDAFIHGYKHGKEEVLEDKGVENK